MRATSSSAQVNSMPNCPWCQESLAEIIKGQPTEMWVCEKCKVVIFKDCVPAKLDDTMSPVSNSSPLA